MKSNENERKDMSMDEIIDSVMRDFSQTLAMLEAYDNQGLVRYPISTKIVTASFADTSFQEIPYTNAVNKLIPFVQQPPT